MKTWHKIAAGVVTFFLLLWALFKVAFKGFLLVYTDWNRNKALFWSPFGIHWVSWDREPFALDRMNARYEIRVVPEDSSAPAHVYLTDSENNTQIIYYFDAANRSSERDQIGTSDPIRVDLD